MVVTRNLTTKNPYIELIKNMKSFSKIQAFFCVVLFFIGAGCVTHASTILGNVLCLGDSITHGWTTAGGYRDPLYTKLTSNGYSLNYIGSQANNPSTMLTNANATHHEGHGGWFVAGKAPNDPNPISHNGLAENLPTFFSSYGAAQPDYILLCIGTNDILNDYYLADLPSRLASLISMISDKNTGLAPNAHLIVAQIIPCTNNNAFNTKVQAYNAAIPGIVANAQALGENVTYVNMYGALNTTTDYYDSVHPNAAGFSKMADVWYDGIMAVPEPGANSLLGCALIGLIFVRLWNRRKYFYYT